MGLGEKILPSKVNIGVAFRVFKEREGGVKGGSGCRAIRVYGRCVLESTNSRMLLFSSSFLRDGGKSGSNACTAHCGREKRRLFPLKV